MYIEFDKNKKKVLEKAKNYLIEILQINKDKPILLLISGGSAFGLLEDFNSSVLYSNITIGVLDERWSDDLEVNNFLQLMNTYFYQTAQTMKCNFIDTRSLGNSQIVVANRFEKALHDWKSSNPDGKVIITQGIGPDGHTAGIMPYPEDKEFFKNNFQSDNWVVAYNTKDKNKYPLRITTTITFLINIVDISIVYVVGDNKKKPLHNLQDKGSVAEVPARVLHQMKEVFIFTDQN